MGRALSLKLQVVDEYIAFSLRQRQKADGQCCAPLDETPKKFNVHKSMYTRVGSRKSGRKSGTPSCRAVRAATPPVKTLFAGVRRG